MEESRRRLNPLYGIGLFLIIMILFVLVFAPLQYQFGMVGLALTEIGLLLVTLLFTFLTGQSFREVFPIARPKLGQIVGTLLIWGGFFELAMLGTMMLMFLFPEGFLDVNSSMNSMFSSTPAFVTFLIVAVMPAICEESMHRGYIQFTFRNVSHDWVIVLCMGLIFGLFHMDPYRFVPTALLGMGLSYVMCKSHNILLPALYHFSNNFLSFLASLSSAGAKESQEAAVELFSNPSYILAGSGVYLCMFFLAPVLLYGGSYLLRRFSGCLPRHSDRRQVLTVTGVVSLSILMFALGFALLMLNAGALMELEEFTQM